MEPHAHYNCYKATDLGQIIIAIFLWIHFRILSLVILINESFKNLALVVTDNGLESWVQSWVIVQQSFHGKAQKKGALKYCFKSRSFHSEYKCFLFIFPITLNPISKNFIIEGNRLRLKIAWRIMTIYSMAWHCFWKFVLSETT